MEEKKRREMGRGLSPARSRWLRPLLGVGPPGLLVG